MIQKEKLSLLFQWKSKSETNTLSFISKKKIQVLQEEKVNLTQCETLSAHELLDVPLESLLDLSHGLIL